MSIDRRSEQRGFSVRIKGMRLIAAGLLAVGVAGEAEAKNELVTGTGFSTSLEDAPVMNNDGQVAYIKHSSLIIIGGVGASFINLDDITNNTFIRIATEGVDVPGGVGQIDSFSVDGQNSIGLRVNDIGQGDAPATVMFHAFSTGLGLSSYGYAPRRLRFTPSQPVGNSSQSGLLSDSSGKTFAIAVPLYNNGVQFGCPSEIIPS